MEDFKNIKVYEKEIFADDEVKYLCLFFKDEKGRDWYKTRKGWKGAIAVDSNGVVCGFETDVSLMCVVEGVDLFEVDPVKVPANVTGNYSYSRERFTDIRPDAAAMAQSKKAELFADASRSVSVLQDAVNLKLATEAEIQLLAAWQKYRVLLNRVDPASAPDIEWPEPPENVA